MKIREDFEAALLTADFTTAYQGTVIRNIPPQLYRRVDKALRKEKSWYDKGQWKYSHITQLITTYNTEDFSMTCKLAPWRKYEVLQDFLRKML